MARKLTADQSHCGQFESEIRAAQQANSGTKAVNSQIVCQRKSCISNQLSKKFFCSTSPSSYLLPASDSSNIVLSIQIFFEIKTRVNVMQRWVNLWHVFNSLLLVLHHNQFHKSYCSAQTWLGSNLWHDLKWNKSESQIDTIVTIASTNCYGWKIGLIILR